jgi:hypothetical protein
MELKLRTNVNFIVAYRGPNRKYHEILRSLLSTLTNMYGSHTVIAMCKYCGSVLGTIQILVSKLFLIKQINFIPLFES